VSTRQVVATLNLACAGSGKTYLGTAAHCVSSSGQPLRDIDGTAFGKVAFIEVDPEDLGRVSPAVKGHPQYPKGSTVPVRTGKALGIVSRLCAGACSEEGPTVQCILAKAAAAGFSVTLRTV
jgi:hypothetical protein